MRGQVLTPWTYRRWRFDFPAELYPAVIERLRGLPARADALAARLGPGQATRAPREGWSIQRHLAHLADLERLLADRLDAYEAGAAVLPAADMQNTRTVEAGHDARPLADVLADVRRVREASVERLEAYPRDFFARSAWHERLGAQKRVVDTCVFFADHDDHHLALAEMVRRQLIAP
ncbi:MAG: DinB family protein [Planctomycetota bacterium]